MEKEVSENHKSTIKISNKGSIHLKLFAPFVQQIGEQDFVETYIDIKIRPKSTKVLTVGKFLKKLLKHVIYH